MALKPEVAFTVVPVTRPLTFKFPFTWMLLVAVMLPAMVSVDPLCDNNEHPTVLVPVHIVIFPEEQVPVRPLAPTSS